MPNRDPSPDSAVPSTILALFRQVHQQLRGELQGLNDATLNWVPMPGANSIATIVRHLVGSEAETLRCVAGVASKRDREAEFGSSGLTGHDVLRLLEEADDLTVALEPRIELGDLSAELPLPTLPPGRERTGLSWLIVNYGHAREHLGQIQITRQIHPGS